jgi:hypothetical protein
MKELAEFFKTVEEIAGQQVQLLNVLIRIDQRLDKLGLRVEEKLAIVAKPTAPIIVGDFPVKGSAEDNREELKKALREKGISFPASARTATLQKLLDAAAETAEPEPAKDPEPETEATIEAVRNALVTLSAGKGKDVALAILQEHGGAAVLGQVPVDRYAALIAACKEARNA